MLVRHETAATLILGALIRAYPNETAAALTSAGVPLEVVVPSTVGIEQGDGERGRMDITADTDRGRLIIEAKLSAYPDRAQIEKYLHTDQHAFAVQLVLDANVAEARVEIGSHPRITVIGWSQLLAGFAGIPIADDLAADLAVAANDPDSRVAKRARMQAVVNAAGLDAAVTATVSETASGYPAITLRHSGNVYALGQVEPDRNGGGTYTGTVGIEYINEDLDNPAVFADFRDALLQAEHDLTAAGVTYRKSMHRSGIHTRLDMMDKPYLARGYSSGNCRYHLGVKVPGDTVDEVLAASARALEVYTALCQQRWPDTVTSN